MKRSICRINIGQRAGRAACAFMVSVVGVATVFGGDLNPPPGPIAPTQRTPIGPNTTPGDADSLFRITQRGSYYLTGNITGVAGKSGIEIAASGVTLDLMGFDLVGVPGSGSGVYSTGETPLSDISVVNGSVRLWGASGVNVANAILNIRLADLRVTGNSVFGIIAGYNAVVTGCAAYANQIGIRLISGGSVADCSANQNTGIGIQVITGSTVTNCSAKDNGGDGFDISTGSTITNCSATSNVGDGISVGQSCVARGNACHGNGFGGGTGAGIRAISVGSGIEGNNCAGNDVGIEADSAGNLIIQNSCRSNPINYDFVLGNRYGPIIDLTAGGNPAVSGSSALSQVASTDPWANFAY